MVCVHCGGDTQVINSRPQKRSNTVWRRRKCLKCGSLVSSEETVDFATAWRVRDRQGGLTPLRRDRLFISLYKSLGHREAALTDAAGLTTTVITKVTQAAQGGVLSTALIAQAAMVALSRFDKVAASHYQAFHKV